MQDNEREDLAPEANPEAWRPLFAPYDLIVLVANSEEALAADLSALWPGRTLFVFFNDARRVVTERFERDAVLVLRSGREGPSVVRRGRLEGVAGRFAGGRLHAIVNLCVDAAEAPTSLTMHGGCPVRLLDLTSYFAARYTGGKIASSGYAMAVWLTATGLGYRVVLCGFSALRSENWKVFDIHDWAFEQTALRLLETSGALRSHGAEAARPTAMTALAAQFPGVALPDLLSVQAEVLSERLEHTNAFVDRLWSATRLQRLARKLLRFGR